MFCSDLKQNSETKNRGTKTLIEYHLAPPRVWSYKSKINVKQLLTKFWKILGNERSVTKAELSFITIVNEILKDCFTRRWEVKCDPTSPKIELCWMTVRSTAGVFLLPSPLPTGSRTWLAILRSCWKTIRPSTRPRWPRGRSSRPCSSSSRPFSPLRSILFFW